MPIFGSNKGNIPGTKPLPTVPPDRKVVEKGRVVVVGKEGQHPPTGGSHVRPPTNPPAQGRRSVQRQVVYEHGEGSGLYTPVYTYVLKSVSSNCHQMGLDLSELSREGWEVVSIYQYAFTGVVRAICRRPLLAEGAGDGK